ncbi:MAG: hypothetical protein IKE60_28600 [Reyranella sp.]|jgi:hypothetical protein|uniref:hypothetical protein n=1 Tax=Reyranella sp. TaxID=1929291 RepID=UPI00095AF874|nr:hypothetical protein [Reyranella sp.]MBN9536080.1 hypothetical protein [Alphaproteobacteria bacterium]MBR2818661.1 hypothetical protein [Reyranella sp.]OJU36183.1 MAG: hypothetical protein BGN99_25640 [Alphaproteobacteria bacterium 65-37]
MSTHQLVARHVEAALAEAAFKGIAADVVARCFLSEAIRIFQLSRPNDDIAAELAAAADNLDEAAPLAFIRP